MRDWKIKERRVSVLGLMMLSHFAFLEPGQIAVLLANHLFINSASEQLAKGDL